MKSMYSYVNLKNWVSTSQSPFWFLLESAASNVFRKSDVGSWENGWNGWSCFLRIERLSITFSYFDHLYHLFPPSITLCIAFAKLHLLYFFNINKRFSARTPKITWKNKPGKIWFELRTKHVLLQIFSYIFMTSWRSPYSTTLPYPITESRPPRLIRQIFYGAKYGERGNIFI